MKLAKAIETPELFVRYLIDNKHNVVGQTRAQSRCPIANFLVDNTEDEMFSVTARCIRRYDRKKVLNIETIPTPEWAKNFIQSLDSMGVYEDVTGLDVLQIMQHLYTISEIEVKEEACI